MNSSSARSAQLAPDTPDVDRGVFVGTAEVSPRVLRFQFFQPLGLVDFHPAVDLAPAIVGLVADTDLLAGLADGFPLAQQNVGFPKLVDDLFGVCGADPGRCPGAVFTRLRRRAPGWTNLRGQAQKLRKLTMNPDQLMQAGQSGV